jgi:voltage-gated potassium channel
MLEKKRISTKQKIYDIVEAVEHSDNSGKFYDLFDILILTLIVLNVIAVILETVAVINENFSVYFYRFEIFSVAVFSVEYILRVYSCTVREKYRRPFWGRIKFMLTPMAIIDLVAILPFFMTFMAVDLRFIRTLRLFRLFRVMKLLRYSQSLKLLGNVLRNRKEEMVITVSIMLVLVILTSSFIYLAENEAQPDKFTDIPTSMWWAIVTLTTVGYGDVFPVTPLGKFFAAIIAVLGIGMFALPTGILGASFVEEIDKMKAKEKPCCPHCGKEI